MAALDRTPRRGRLPCRSGLGAHPLVAAVILSPSSVSTLVAGIGGAVVVQVRVMVRPTAHCDYNSLFFIQKKIPLMIYSSLYYYLFVYLFISKLRLGILTHRDC